MITATKKDQPKRYEMMKALIQNALDNPEYHARVLLQEGDVTLFWIHSDARRIMVFYQSDKVIGYSQLMPPRTDGLI